MAAIDTWTLMKYPETKLCKNCLHCYAENNDCWDLYPDCFQHNLLNWEWDQKTK